MTSVRFLRRAVGAFACTAAAILGSGSVAAATLPSCIPNVTCLQFGDFNVFSLALLELQRTGGTSAVPGPSSPYYFASGYGQIQQYTILGINNGQPGAGNLVAGVDGAYNTPSAANVNVFSTATTPDPDNGGGNAPFIGDTSTTWDIRLSSLQSIVNAPPAPVTAFFAFNEQGSGGGLEGSSLLIWAKVTLSNDDGSNSADFYLRTGPGLFTPSLNDAGCGLGTASCLPDPASDPNSGPGQAALAPWVYVHAGICTVGTSFVGFPDANGSCAYLDPTAVIRNQNNLGQNAAAFMINSPALDAAIASGLYTYMNVLWQEAYIDNGGETAWLQPFDAPTVPEPSTLASIGVAILGLSFLRRRRRVT